MEATKSLRPSWRTHRGFGRFRKVLDALDLGLDVVEEAFDIASLPHHQRSDRQPLPGAAHRVSSRPSTASATFLDPQADGLLHVQRGRPPETVPDSTESAGISGNVSRLTVPAKANPTIR